MTDRGKIEMSETTKTPPKRRVTMAEIKSGDAR